METPLPGTVYERPTSQLNRSAHNCAKGCTQWIHLQTELWFRNRKLYFGHKIWCQNVNQQRIVLGDGETHIQQNVSKSHSLILSHADLY